MPQVYKHKARIIRDDLEVNMDAVKKLGGPVEQVVWREVKRNGRMQSVPFWKRGTVLEATDAFRLVQQGVAEPADAECDRLACRTREQLDAAQHAYERLNRGIHPDDFELFDAGVIEGYKPDGSFLPGKNWDKYQAEKAAAESGEEDEG
jgi:hypothetical protein